MNEMDDMNERRQFLSKSATLAGVVLTPGLILYTVGIQADDFVPSKEPNQPISNKTRWGLLVDTEKCAAGCDACVQACNAEHGLQSHGRPESDAQWIRKVTIRHKATGREASLPFMCQHCEHPPCVDVCPTGASFKRIDGIVLVDKHICIGCRYCMMACPYKARSFVHERLENQRPHSPRGKGTVESCTLCVYRVDNGQLPACVEACSRDGHQALLFGDMNNPQSAIAQRLKRVQSRALRDELYLNPGVRYEGL